ncbi:MAG TPA: DUF192 domain-containing protein, partial [Methanocella sp.]|nr:DUF192 domain-containing protein [Methanocella sp.]
KASSIVVVAVLVILALAAAYYLSAYVIGDEGDRVEFVNANGTVTTIYVEVADTPQAQQRGLMERASLDEHNGMLFVFSVDGPESFWMENTPLPLDMIFVNHELAIVDINHNATPYSRDVFTSKESCRYVVEVNGGFCDKYGIGVGDRMRIYLKPSPA